MTSVSRSRVSLESLLLACGVALLPIYVFPSGGIQPAHLLFFAFSILLLKRKGVLATNWAMLYFVISGYIFCVESIYAIHDGGAQTLIIFGYFFYNFVLSVGVYQFCRERSIDAIAPGLLIACVIAVSIVALAGVNLYELGDEGRSTGTFNNPNQLGFFSVCVLSLAYLLYKEHAVNYKVTLAFVTTSIFLAIVSLSKAAIISTLIVLPFVLKPSGSNRRSGVAWWVLICCVGISFVLYLYSTGFFDNYLFVSRIQNMLNEDDSTLASRGYFAFFGANSVQWLFGLGAENVRQIVGHEVHSTFGSIFNTYGLIGFLLFLSIILIWLFKLLRAYGVAGVICLAGPALLYGISHNGVRFSIFWLLFASSMAMAYRRCEGRRLCGAYSATVSN